MKELKSLLKKVEVFEKLALYGDRRSFLKSIAQMDPSAINTNENSNQVIQAINDLNNSIQSWIKNSAERQSDLPGGMIAGLPQGMRTPAEVMRKATISDSNVSSDMFNIDTYSKIYLAARNLAAVANLGDMGDNAKKAWMTNVFPKASNVISLVGKEIQKIKQYQSENSFPETPNEPSQVADNTAPNNLSAPNKASYPSIPRDVQEQLSRIVSVDGIGLPLKRNDGLLGPETKAALDNFRQKYNVPGNFDNAQVFEVIRNTFARDKEKYQ